MKHFVIYVPGLGDKKLYAFAQRAALSLWRTSRVTPLYFVVGWADTKEPYEHKLQRLLRTIDDASAKGYTVSIVAASAGPNLALTALAKRKNIVHRVVSICGKINHPETVNDALSAINPAFKASMLAYAKIEQALTGADRKKILVVHATHDSFVPARDGKVAGAHTHTIHSMGHALSIFMAITLFRHVSLRFIKS